MDEEYAKTTIENDVLPKIDEMLDEESAFYLYIEYGDGSSGARTLISPAPPMDNIEEVMRKVAKEIHKNTNGLPSLIIACERIIYSAANEDDVDVELRDSGLIIVAMEASTAEGIACLYSLPDKELLAIKRFNSDSEDVPPYTMLAVSSFMHETLEQEGLLEKRDDDPDDKSEVKFKFSRN